MAVSQAPAGIEKPLEIAIQGSGGSISDSAIPGTLVIADASVADDSSRLAVLATSFQAPPNRSHEQLAVEAVVRSVQDAGPQHLAEAMKTGFREANRAVFGQMDAEAGDGVGMLALATRGKYATLALVGHDRAYLARAGRLNQLTRDQRVTRARSRRKQDEAATAGDAAPPVRLIGEAERLDSKSPAIFEIVLLPEDRLALLSHDLVERVGEDAILSGLQQGSVGGARELVSSVDSDTSSAMMAVVLSVAPVRDTTIVYAQPAAPARPVWIIIVAAVLLLAIFAAVAYFML